MGKLIERLEDLKPDPENANRGTPRGHGIIGQSISRHGAGRSGLAANDGTMIAGSQTLEEIAALGIPIRAVHTTGDEWVVVIRDDIEPGSEQAILMGLEDNQSTLVGVDFDPAVLADIGARLDLSGLFHPDEMAAVLEQAGTDLLVPDPNPQREPELKNECFIEIYCTRADLADFRSVFDTWSKRASVTINIQE